MAKLSNANSDTLPEFQKYLVEKKLAAEKNVHFLAYWVSRFLGFARRRGIDAAEYRETSIQEFIEALRSDKRTLDWQPKQADDAIKLYYFHYLGKSRGQAAGRSRVVDVDGALKADGLGGGAAPARGERALDHLRGPGGWGAGQDEGVRESESREFRSE